MNQEQPDQSIDIKDIQNSLNKYTDSQGLPTMSESECYEFFYTLRDLIGSTYFAKVAINNLSFNSNLAYKQVMYLQSFLV